jgi:cyclophilin family peptidyl-prolyl cis-trans isomerase/protein-disulfide isomerase
MKASWLLLVTALVACTPITTAVPTPPATSAPTRPPQPTQAPDREAVPVDASSIFPPASGSDWVLGPADARVTILEYADYQCPYCAELAPTLKRLHESYPDDVRLIYRHYPLPFHDKARLAAEAAETAGAQGKFWEMHNLLYETFAEWEGESVEAFRARLSSMAGALELDVERFDQDLDAGRYRPVVDAAIESAISIQLPDGETSGLPGTPFLVINGEIWQGPRDYWIFEALVKLEQLRDRQVEAPEDIIDLSKSYRATLQTEKGEIVIELFDDQAPVTVNSFVFLARRGWYDEVTFHRVIPGFVAQAGDPTGTGFGGPGYTIVDEIDPARTFDGAGWVAMANAGPNTGGSQFFITLDAQPNLDGRFTIFGRVTAGLDVVQALAARDPQSDPTAAPGDKILSVAITEE